MDQLTTKKRNSSKEDHVECMMGYWGCSLRTIRQTITTNYCDQFHCLKTALNGMLSCLVSRKDIIFQHDNAQSSHNSTDQRSLRRARLGNIASSSIFSKLWSFWSPLLLRIDWYLRLISRGWKWIGSIFCIKI